MVAKHAKSTVTPKLRFPDFSKSKGWDKTALSSVLFEHKLKSDGKSEVHSVSLTKGVILQIEHMGRSFAAADTSHYSLVKPFDVIYTKSPLALYKLGIVKQHRRSRNAIVSPLYGVFEPANKYIGQLVAAYFDSPSRCLRYLDPLAQKGAKNTIQISNDRFLSGEIYLPDDEREQQKIADCLTSLDDVIAGQGRKVKALKAHKRALMQQLFPREGETVPRLRFPEFRDGAEWLYSSMKSVVNMKAGTFVSASDIAATRNGDSFPCFGGNGQRGFTKTSTHSGKFVLIGRQGALCGNVSLVDGQFHATEHALVVTPAADADVDWLYYMLTFLNLNQYATGQAQPGLSVTLLERLSALVPTDVREQQRIGECLSSLDAAILGEAEKLDALRTHKKGLMQQLFPAVTAE